MTPTPVVCQLTGLSTVKLREWTCRRALIPADIPAPKRGAAALYSWQTVLVLRLAIVLHDAFHVELSAQKVLFDGLRAGLDDQPFHGLWGKWLIIGYDSGWRIGDHPSLSPGSGDCLILRLDSHLSAIADAFALPQAGGGRRNAAA